MLLRSTLCAGVAAASLCALVLLGIPALWAQTAPPAAAAPSASNPAQPPPGPTEGLATKPGDAFGVDMNLVPEPIVYVKGSGTWDTAFATISASLKQVESYMREKGLKASGLPMTIFTATDDNGFDYEAALPIAELPKNPPHGDVDFGQSPAGRALEFVHRGSYDALDDTYEAITNYLDDKRLESKDLLIEQYVTDPASTDGKNMVVNVLVLVK
jgi:effector-binding domain-containing protein